MDIRRVLEPFFFFYVAKPTNDINSTMIKHVFNVREISQMFVSCVGTKQKTKTELSESFNSL